MFSTTGGKADCFKGSINTHQESDNLSFGQKVTRDSLHPCKVFYTPSPARSPKKPLDFTVELTKNLELCGLF